MSETNPSEAGSLEAAMAEAAELQKASRYAEAAEVYLAITRRTVTTNLAANLGVCLTEVGRWAEAEHWLSLAVRHMPAEPTLRRLLGNLCAETGEVGRAEAEYRAGLAIDPQHAPLRLALGGLLLSLGRYAEGWPLQEARLEVESQSIPPVALSFPEWTGGPLDGKSIAVWQEQGLGDQIQMSRFASELKARGAAHVALACRPPLTKLLATVPGVDEVIGVGQGEVIEIRRYDFWTRYFSLPARLGTTLETLPAAPYLRAPASAPERRAGAARIGLAWRASPTGFNTQNKSLPDPLAQRLLDLGAISLHPEDTGAEDFADTAAIVEQLDLVISIDTSVAHLAGAMGKPCWTLLPRIHSDWRWLRDRRDSPWYPSMRLYRQATPGAWEPVIDQVVADLAARSSGR